LNSHIEIAPDARESREQVAVFRPAATSINEALSASTHRIEAIALEGRTGSTDNADADAPHRERVVGCFENLGAVAWPYAPDDAVLVDDSGSDLREGWTIAYCLQIVLDI